MTEGGGEAKPGGPRRFPPAISERAVFVVFGGGGGVYSYSYIIKEKNP